MTLKEQIIVTAYNLFAEKGYDKTSVAEIIEKAGSSKGGFYHHFKSKEEILETISLSYIETIKEINKTIISNNGLAVVDKFLEYFIQVEKIKKESFRDWSKLKNVYTFSGNHVLFKRMGERFEAETTHFYTSVIVQGNNEGIFHVPYPKELAALWSREVLQIYRCARKLAVGDYKDEKQYMNLLLFNQQMINQQLGLKPSTIELVKIGMRYLDTIKEELNRRGEIDD